MNLPEDFPELQPTDRDREFNAYDPVLRGEIIHHYLTQGLTHRELDETFLGLSRESSRGYQSMGILHFVGLRPAHSPRLKGWSVSDMIAAFRASPDPKAHLIAEQLAALSERALSTAVESVTRGLETQVASSQRDSSEARKRRLAEAPSWPSSTIATTTVFRRNPDVVAEVLSRAMGNCEDCRAPAPFNRRSDGTPYLEIHHLVRLADGGKDTVENAVALCPNCHRKAHFG